MCDVENRRSPRPTSCTRTLYFRVRSCYCARGVTLCNLTVQSQPIGATIATTYLALQRQLSFLQNVQNPLLLSSSSFRHRPYDYWLGLRIFLSNEIPDFAGTFQMPVK
jgi:hypothetical protein